MSARRSPCPGHAAASCLVARVNSPCGLMSSTSRMRIGGDRFGPADRDVGRRDRLGQAEQYPGGERAGDAAEAAEDDHAERQPDPGVLRVRGELVEEAERGAAEGGGRGRDGEDPGADLPRLDPDEPGALRVLRGGGDGVAEPGPLEADWQRRGDGDREQAGVQLRSRYRDRAEGERLVEVGRGGRRRVRPPDQGDDGLGDQRDGERHDDRQPVVQPLHPLDDEPVDADAERRERHGHDERAEQRVDAQVRPQGPAEVGGQDQERALRQVDDLHDPEGQRQPGGHQRVDAAGEHAEDHGLEQLGHPLPQAGLASSTVLLVAAEAGATTCRVPCCHWDSSRLPSGSPRLVPLERADDRG